MRSTSQKRSRLALESLETRDTPAGLWSAETFDSGPRPPADWDVTSTGDLHPTVTTPGSSDVPGALTLPPGTRAWEQSILPTSAAVQARVRLTGPARSNSSSGAETYSPRNRPTTLPRSAAMARSGSRKS